MSINDPELSELSLKVPALTRILDQQMINIGTLEDGGQTFAFLPQHFRTADLEEFQDAPSRIRRHLEFDDVRSLVEYAERFGSDHSAMYIAPARRSFKYIVDEPEAQDAPAWGSHLASCQPRFSSEFEPWWKLQERSMSQDGLIDFLTDNRHTLKVPSGSELLGLIGNFRLTTSGSFQRSVNLDNGDSRLEYTSESQGVTGVDIPRTLTLECPVYQGGADREITINFRYRQSDGNLAFMLPIDRCEAVIDEAFAQLVIESEDAPGVAYNVR